MCCRYYIDRTEELLPMVEEMNRSPLLKLFQQRGGKVIDGGEVRPTNVAPAIATSRSGARAIFPMQWGFTGKSLIINARVETAGVKPMFQESWKTHRCILPASWYFEWEHLPDPSGKTKRGDKFMIHPRGTEGTWLCGLYRMEEGLPHFVVLTRETAESIRFIHDRMPVMLPALQAEKWINPALPPEEMINTAETDVVFERARPELPLL